MESSLPIGNRTKVPHSFSRSLRIAQFAVYAFIVLHAIAWHGLGIHVLSKICPFTFGKHIAQLEFNAAVLLWLIVFGSALVLGRAFCAWGCMFGAFQDLVGAVAARLKLKPIGRRWGDPMVAVAGFFLVLSVILWGDHKPWGSVYWHLGAVTAGGVLLWLLVERPAGSLRIALLPKYLYLAQFLGAILASWVSLNVLATGPTFAFHKYGVLDHLAWPFLATEAVLIALAILFVEKRAFCKYMCPIGLLFRFVAAIPFPGKFRVRVLDDSCTECGTCDRVCRTGIRPSNDIVLFGEVRNPNCVHCLECVSKCPNATLGFTRRSGIAARGTS